MSQMNLKLIKKITVEEAEREHAVLDARLGRKPVPFGFQNSEWTKLLSLMESQDELWEHDSSVKEWEMGFGRAGIVLLRDGEVVYEITSRMN